MVRPLKRGVVSPIWEASFAAELNLPLTILHVANFADRPKGAGFAAVQYKLTNGLIRAGHHVVTFSDRDAARAATPLLSRKVGRRGANRRLMALVENLQPHVVLFGHADTVCPQTLVTIRERVPGVRLAQWNVDPLFDADNVERIRSKIALVDWTFVTTGGPLLKALGADGDRVAFLPNPADISIERGRAFEHDSLPWDVFYAVGSGDFARWHCGVEITPRDLVERMQAHLPGRRFLTPGIDQPHLSGEACNAALREARIGLNISRRNDVTWYASDRMAHMMGNGLLTATERASGFGDLFAEDEMLFYSSEGELLALLDRYLNDDASRRAVARKGWRAYHRMFDSTRVSRYLMAVMQEELDPATFDWRSEDSAAALLRRSA